MTSKLIFKLISALANDLVIVDSLVGQSKKLLSDSRLAASKMCFAVLHLHCV